MEKQNITATETVKSEKEWINEVWEKIDKKLSRTALKSRNKIPYTTVCGEHDDRSEIEPDWWTNGFFGGMMWLMFSETKNEVYKETAKMQEKLMDRALADFRKLHHDVGFMWHILSGASYRLTGDKASETRNFFAAASLASRYNIDGKYIRAWNSCGDLTWENDAFRSASIIDCMMNIPLLYWASRELDDPRFARIAKSHADMAMRDHVRPDGSVNHIVSHDPETGEAIKILDGQGYSPESCWSRGAAWAIYGFALSYIHTGKKEYLDTAIKCANYFIVNCKNTGYKTVIDFKAPKTPVYYDSTAGVCAACGILEIAKYVTEAESENYIKEAINILKATDESFCSYSEDEDALVLMGSERYPLNEEQIKTVHIPIIYGDFFFVEAMLKLKGNDFLIW